MAKIPSIIEQYRPSLYVLASQVVAATLNAAAKFIETTDEAVHPFMILTPNDTSKVHMLLGTHDVRWLLVLRALGGICSATGFFCALGALLGVMLIAQPEGIFNTSTTVYNVSEDAHDRLYGLGFGILGFCGGVVALTSIRRIGTRAHPLTSVNIFAWWLMILSGMATIITQGITWPKSPIIWGVLFYIGICGVLMLGTVGHPVILPPTQDWVAQMLNVLKWWP
uniref:Putative transport protein n=1 Tax=Talaromyces marneffei PM1 TaxID=1077442 RepID=A0A093XFR0_TALMA